SLAKQVAHDTLDRLASFLPRHLSNSLLLVPIQLFRRMPLLIYSPILEIFPLSLKMSHLDWISANYPYLPIFLHLNPLVSPCPSFDLLLFLLSCFSLRNKAILSVSFPL